MSYVTRLREPPLARAGELPEIREKLKSKFAVVDASQITAWETLLTLVEGLIHNGSRFWIQHNVQVRHMNNR
jgi:hypothetical protein